MFYWLMRGLLLLLMKVCFRISRRGQENIPYVGAVIIASNHASNLDPCLVGSMVDRSSYFMAKEELFRIPLLGWWINKVNGFPIRRGAVDRRAMRCALEILGRGDVLVMFPEGTRTRDGLLGKMQSGIAALAARTGAAVVPTYVEGSFGAMRRGQIIPRPRRVCVWFGAPLVFTVGRDGDSDKLYERFAETLTDRIRDLKENSKQKKKEGKNRRCTVN